MKSIMVHGVEYKIIVDKKIKKRGLAGEALFEKKIIKMYDLADKATLLHELFHATLYEIGFHQIMNDDIEEIIVENLSQIVATNFTLRVKNGR